MKNYALSPLIENLTMMTSQKWQINVICIVENCHSYNISKSGRKWSYTNRDMAQRSLPCRFMFGKNWPPIDITRKYEKLCIVAFNRKFDYDDVTKWQITVIFLVENCLSYNISKFGLNQTNGSWDTNQNEIWPLTFICITKMVSYQRDVFM